MDKKLNVAATCCTSDDVLRPARQSTRGGSWEGGTLSEVDNTAIVASTQTEDAMKMTHYDTIESFPVYPLPEQTKTLLSLSELKEAKVDVLVG